MMTLGERLKQLRIERGWTLNVLSAITRVSIAYLSDLERGRTLPSITMLTGLANIYRLSVASVLTPVMLPGELYPACMPEPLPFDDIPTATEDWLRENKVSSQYDPDYFVSEDVYWGDEE